MLQVWNTTEKNNECAKVGDAVITACQGQPACDACAVAMAQVYQNYESELNDMYSGIFSTYESKMFNNLEAENKKIQVLNQKKAAVWSGYNLVVTYLNDMMTISFINIKLYPVQLQYEWLISLKY